MFNLLDYSAGTVKVSSVTKEDDEKLRRDYPTGILENMVWGPLFLALP